jgi:chemosensory pili system protein ChpA (sensor histidine kinase/response regulator)
MSERRDYVALDWVAGEIQETLTQATQALQAYIANRDDTTKLRFCLTHIHQVHGTLKMVEFFGAALLAEEMEALAQALTLGAIHDSHIDDALKVLNNAIAHLPVYLDRVKESRQGLPSSLLPILNDLRAVRGENLLSETVLFAPDLTVSKVEGKAAKLLVEGNELKDVVHKLRQMYQIALLGLIREQEIRKNVNYLAKVCARLSKLSAGRAGQPLWQVCIAVLEGILNSAIEPSVAVKILLRQVDREIKLLLENAEAALEKAPPEHLLKNLLYYIACCKANSRYIKQIKNEYNLEASLLGDNESDEADFAAPDSLAMQSVVGALSQEITEIKSVLSAAGTNAKALTKVLPLFRRVSDTMAILGMGSTLKPIQDSHTNLAKLLATQDVINVKDVEQISQRISLVEADLKPDEVIEEAAEQTLFNDSEEAQEQLDGAFDSVIRESRAGLEQTKEAIIEFVATQWNHNCLSDVPGMLSQIHGSLAMVPLDSAAAIIKSCESYVNQELLELRAVPEWQMLDTLADAITSIDYYLERLADDSSASNDGILEVAAESVAELGYPVDPLVSNVTPTKSMDQNKPEVDASKLSEPSPVVDAGGSPEPSKLPALAEVIPFKSPSNPERNESANVEALYKTALPVDQSSQPQTESQVSEPSEQDEDFDPEIVEIFIEEAGEVLETIEEYLPQWQANHNDEEARSTVRRAFHTLKGSGRMVNAVDIGELAWAIENMLNRVLDNTFNMDEARFDMLARAKGQVPAMVSAFENRQPFDMASIEGLIAQAEALAKEQAPESIAPVVKTDVKTVVKTDTDDRLAEPEVVEFAIESEPVESSESIDTIDITEFETQHVDEDSGIDQIQDTVAEGVDDGVAEGIVESNELDAELLEIFAAETTTHLQILDDFVAHSKELAGPADLTDELQRALHTLRGSANMAGVTPVAMLITPVEHVIKELKACQLKIDAPLVDMLEKASGLIRLGIEQLDSAPMQSLPGVESFVDELMVLYKERIASTADDSAQEISIVPQAQNQFLSDSLDRINEINAHLLLWHTGDFSTDDFDGIEFSINQLIDQAENINMISLAEFGQALQALYRCAANFDSTQISNEFYHLASEGSDALIDMLDQFAGHQSPEYDQQLLAQIQDYEFATAEPVEDQGLLSEQAETDFSIATEINVSDDIAETKEESTNDDLIELLSEDSEWLASEEVIEVDLESIPAGIMADIVEVDASALSDSLEVEINVDALSEEADTALEALNTSSNEDASAEPEEASGESDQDVDTVTEIMIDLAAVITADKPVSNETVRPVAPFSSDNVVIFDDDDDEVDAEILEIFLEEADDLLESMDEAIHKWNDDQGGRQYLDDLQRILHTLKGGARLTNQIELGDLSHNFETFLFNAESDNTAVDEAFLSEVQQFQDQLIAQVTAIKAGDIPSVSDTELPVDEVTLDTSAEKDTAVDHARKPLADDDRKSKTAAIDTVLPIRRAKHKVQTEVVPFVASRPGAATAAAIQPQPMTPNVGDAVAKKGPQEVVKVSAQLLEDLVNLAGETSISRGQSEEQISELVFSLDEMQITVDRLQEQVRRLDMETEQQILYRQEQVESEGLEGFDPLEMDRYSALQQLSRSLLESSSDLIDIKSTLSEKSRDMETLLVQQSRINTELQEGLMRSRMVPFSRMVPRLRRIVRQVSGELNKKVDFKLNNIEGELDRTVLEKMVAPLEHMLRNAVDHGLESTEERVAANKPKKGTVALGLHREGGEIVLTLSDDGAGINLEAVKNKAIERGLMEPDANLSDHEISQFILQSGFSTATAVTQLSGRGVGMDVVHSEIKQLGGGIDIESVPGQGTHFIVRLPFTVSVNRALMVSVDGDIYAIPLNTIEGIVRVSPFELEAYYQPDAPMFEYAGQPYLLRYMGALLRRGEKPMLEGQSMPLPVVLVRGADHSVAIQVDHLMGSREIVVKPLGPQFSMVQGLSGATVLGDGSVVVILDLLAMIRADASHLHKDFVITQDAVDKIERSVSVMVVDDSVTVRKVTSRFLERQGMEVLLAKDGADAMAQLLEIERVPDIMLLDIEMPRMDGFEVASRVRHNTRLKDLPIIMITSRTGEKHRERALSLGVNYYMGKPYQEVELLETINSLTGITAE